MCSAVFRALGCELSIKIAIDGPASSGKGTVARLVARAMSYSYIDTGAMYRAVALMARRAGVAWEDSEALTALTVELGFRFTWSGERLITWVNGEDVSLSIRDPGIGQGASRVSVHRGVREALVEVQRTLAWSGGVVMEGRDIGTVVLPDAELKVFLDADVVVRARRRAAELQSRGEAVSQEAVEQELRVRDARDRGRKYSPLKQAGDAVYLDTTAMSPGEAAETIAAWARQRA